MSGRGFIEDWKLHYGWNKLSKQQGVKGATQGVLLSLLCDHLLSVHPEQSARLKNKQPGLPVGCLTERVKMDTLVKNVSEIVMSKDVKSSFEKWTQALKDVLPDRDSLKHMSGLDLGRLETTESLKYQHLAYG